MTCNRHETRALLINVIGTDAAFKLMQTRNLAGCTFDIPKGGNGRGEKTIALFSQAIGSEATDKLMSHFGGERIYIPRDQEYRRMLRNRRIVEAYNKGQSVNEIASDFDLSDRRVWEVLKTTDMSAVH
ncbi:Mor transcription activator family protein [Undibacterium sp. Ji49W]|uniref:Mor transcription activator family protein n=1 Tax=Undibacterium sp. Ji49W TaxID=3413040 RepID=UPI003BF17F95